MIASLLTDDTLTLENVPHLADVEQLIRILGNHGVDYSVNGRRERQSEGYSRTINFTARNIVDTTAPYELVSQDARQLLGDRPAARPHGRGQGVAAGRLRHRHAPGRPVHRRPAGARRQDRRRERLCRRHAPGTRLVGNRYVFPKVSVGATHVLMMAATLARGETVLENAAREPEVVNLAECLNAMGARITGAGTLDHHHRGRRSLSGARHRVLPDRIETGTYAMAVAMTGGDVLLEGARADLLQSALDVIAPHRRRDHRRPIAASASCATAPASRRSTSSPSPSPASRPTCRRSSWALMTMAKGMSQITETIFENRFMHVQELARLGARITLSGQTAIVEGVARLKGAPVMATDLRASVSLVIAGLAAEGETMVNRVYHLDRGFERLEEKLSRCGAVIERISG